ncbi:MAG: GspH/FimT family pseudopilin [Sulfuritalea sp.]|nr:GspH/FimT family pseudopilin [Sulfuritalea sp.]
MTKSPPLLQRCQPGFTLIELVTVLMITGILAFVVLPRFDLLRGFDEVGYRDKVKATLEYARKSAVAMRRQVRVTIAGSGLTVEFQKQTPELEGTAAWSPLNLPGSGTHSFAAPADVSLTPAAATIVFDALGRPDAGKSFTLSGGAGTIVVEAETGYVH